MERLVVNSFSTTEVMAAIKASQYATYKIDDADFIETQTGEWYLVELESGKQDVKLRIDTTGKIL